MSTIVTRTGKGSALTWAEADANFTNLNTDKAELTSLSASTGSSLIGFLQDGTGSTPRTVQTKLYDQVSVKDFGAVGDGVTNDTVAVQAAIDSVSSSGGKVHFPAGTYVVAPLTLSAANYVTLVGDNKYASKLLLASTGTLLTVSNCQWFCVSNLGFSVNSLPQAIANSHGLQLDTESGNAVITDCSFIGFSLDGLRLVGTVSAPLSGNKVNACYFLGNGNSQLYSKYNHDFIFDSNQFGSLAGISHSLIGCQLENSNSGTYSKNYHWNNVVGLSAVTCSYNTYSLNRVEESDHENVYMNGGDQTIFSLNKCHTGSQTTSGTYDNVFLTNMGSITIIGNVLFSWDASYSRWGINIDDGCSTVTIGKNRVSGFSASYGPYRVAGSVGTISSDYNIFGNTNAQSGSGQTIYIGTQILTSVEVQATTQMPNRCQVLRIWAAPQDPPGTGETFTYTLRKGAVDTAMVAVASGASAWTTATNTTVPAVLFAVEDGMSMKLVTSSAPVAANHRFYAIFAEY